MTCRSAYEKNLRLAEQCAPVLAGIKPANLLMLEGVDTEEVKEMIRDSDVGVYFLYKGKKKCAWLLYREKNIRAVLNQKEVQRFLQTCGYPTFQMEDVLERLGERASCYLDGEMEYPHELGIILGYPLEDVRGFIEFEGKNYLLSGCWKVYGDVEKARQTFALYHKVRQEAVSRIMEHMINKNNNGGLRFE
ncbi:DUF3793 family protein [Novisyntrophococcus fermenticellae]|uniref:DUF3793 family protein n=1 Tax=Novisyntrophococcus fermenticellae TaxID=2068655 RepID=UPI001E3254A9|nr:DUF3793 family protein [Novisyntrophococcus fermenticellae]